MTSKTHIGFGVLTLAVVNIFMPFNFILAVCPAIVGSVLPDVDTEQSWAAQTIPYADDLLRYISKKSGLKFFKHRSWITHSIFIPAILSSLVFLYFNTMFLPFLIGMLCGYFSHVLLDFIAKHFIKTGGSGENIVYNMVWILAIVLMFVI